MPEEYIVEEQSNESEDKFKTLKNKLKQCEKERKEYLEGWQRARADFLNYVKQKDALIEDIRKFAKDDLIFRIFPILDNLTIAVNLRPEDMKDHTWVRGITNVKRQFENVLKEEGIEEMKIEKGDNFNVSMHEAIESIESSSVESGKIVDIIQNGYTLHGRVIRVARVRVAK